MNATTLQKAKTEAGDFWGDKNDAADRLLMALLELREPHDEFAAIACDGALLDLASAYASYGRFCAAVTEVQAAFGEFHRIERAIVVHNDLTPAERATLANANAAA
jgi:hypothetical protein